jgi:hypothetical protein
LKKLLKLSTPSNHKVLGVPLLVLVFLVAILLLQVN